LLFENPDSHLFEWVVGKRGLYDRDTYLESENNSFIDLKKGTYYIYVQVEWFKHETFDPESQYLSFNSYGSSKVSFCENECNKFTKKEILSQAFISKATKGKD
jgi:hypothetical protein